MMDITVLGDTANTAARLTSAAGIGEMILSEDVRAAVELDQTEMESRKLDLKGKSEPFDAWVVKVSPGNA